MNRPARLLLAGVLALTAAVCWPAIDAPFTHDEEAGIAGNRTIRPGAPIGPVLAYRFSPDQARPVFFLSLWADAQRAGRIVPRPFRITSLLLHLVCGTLLYALLRRVDPADTGEAGPLAGAALFLLHPLQAESVLYIWGRSGVIATLFVLAALALTLRAEAGDPGALATPGRRSRAWLRAGGMVCALVALATKEEAIVLPLLFLVWWSLVEGRPTRTGLGSAAWLATVVIVFLAWRAAALGGLGRQVFARGVIDNILGQALVAIRMVRLFLLPSGQSVDHAAAVPAPPVGILALALCLLAVATAIAAGLGLAPFRGRTVRTRRCAAGFLFAAAGCLIYWLVPLPDLMSERRLYLPIVGAAVIVAALAAGWGAPPRPPARAPASLLLPFIPALLVAAVLAPLLLARARVWADSKRLWEEAARGAPGNVRPWINLGVLAAGRGDREAAARSFDRAVALEPGNPEALYNRGRLRLDQGDLDGARTDLAAALVASPGMVRARVNLAIARIRSADLAGAEADLRVALELDPDEPRALTNLAEVLRATGRTAEALPLYRQALDADPFYAHAAVRLGVALEALGDLPGAIDAYRDYLRRGPASAADGEAVRGKIDRLEREGARPPP